MGFLAAPKQAADISIVRSLAQQRGEGTGDVDAESWSSNYEESKAIGKKENKPVFIDFTGYSCADCRVM